MGSQGGERREAEARATALLAMDQRLVARLIEWGAQRHGDLWDPTGPWKHRAKTHDAGLFDAVTAYHYRAEWITTVEAFLAEAGAELTEPERSFLVAQSQVWPSYWLIEAVVADGRLALRDLLSGELRAVTAPHRPAGWSRDRVLLARVLDHDEVSVIVGAHSVALTREEAEHARRLADGNLEGEDGHVSVARLRRSDAAMILIGCWRAVLSWRGVPRERPTHDAEGHLFIHVEDRLSFPSERHDEVTRLLDGLPGKPSRFQPGWRLVARGDVPLTIHESGRLGSFEVGVSGRLTLESFTIEDADELRALVEQRCPGLLRFQVRLLTDLEVLYESQRAANLAAAAAAPPRPPVTPDAEAQSDSWQLYQNWVDQPCAALHGLTPREVGLKKGPRTELRQLLEDFERVEAEQPAGRRVDLSFLRTELLRER